MDIGFIGLGALGGAIAARVLDAGLSLSVWARNQSRVENFIERGAIWHASPASLVAAADIVVLCVSDTEAVESVCFAADGLAAAAPSTRIVVDHSTIHPHATRTIAERLHRANGLRWLDVPVTGGVPAAKAGTLVAMAGGDAASLNEVQGLLQHYTQRVTHMGPVGSGQASKIANQMLIGAQVAAVAEALNYAANAGVDAASLPDALAGGWADSAVLQHHARLMAAAQYSDNINARIMAKDLDIACDLGRLTDSPMPMTAQSLQMYRQLIANGDENKGQIGLMWLYRQDSL